MTTWPLNRSAAPSPRTPIQCWFPAPSRVSPLEDGESSASGAEMAGEGDCIRETQNGRPEAFNLLVAHYAPRIRAYLHRMVRNHEEAEDLTQETFLKAFQALPRFQADRPFKRWLYTIATNTGLNALRTRRRKGIQVELDPETLAARAPATPAVENSRGDQLEAAVAALPARAVQLITLHYHEGFTLREAGEVLGMSESAAKVALCRARQQLRRRLLPGDIP